MADSVGQIGLDLVVNQKQFNKQMSGIKNLAKKAAAALAAAFAVKKIADFGAQCLELGSNLAEVQNVVDVSFPRMSKQVNDFANKATTAFGLSETMAKKFTGTFGAMAKAFGFGEQQAYEMSTALTGLAGDVASFYNISQEEAYTKLKSVFTGETETLKELGIVMTQSALDAYALANGYGKISSKMSEAEKVALRYAFVQDQLTLASGDFARTSGSWANQVRILTLQFDSLKATIGQGLINLFTPIIKVVNILIGKLATLANAFKAFTELITGNKSSGGNIGNTAAEAGAAQEGLNGAAGAADGLAAATKGAGNAAKKAAKEMRQLSGIDKLNNMTSSDPSSGSGGGGGGGAAGSAIDYGSMAEGETVLDKQNKKLQTLINRAKELAELFKKGFKIGIGDLSVLDNINKSIYSIGKNLKGIFNDKTVKEAANNLLNNLAENLGKIAGSITSIGLTIADNLLGGIDTYLMQNKKRIKDFLISIFDIGADLSNIIGNFAAAFADIFTVFRSSAAKQITADIIAIFANSSMAANELLAKIAKDLLDTITAPFIQNKDIIKQALFGTLEAVQPVIEGIKNVITGAWDKIHSVYNKHVKTTFDSFKNGITELFETLFKAYNKHFLPVIKNLGKKFKEVLEKHILPALEVFLDLLGALVDAIQELWKNTIQPFIKWMIENILPILAPIFEGVGSAVVSAASIISDNIKSLLDILSGLIDFIVGVFTGDWKKAWEGIKKAVTAPIEAMCNTASTLIKTLVNSVTSNIKAFSATWKSVWSGIVLHVSSKFKTVKTAVSTVMTGVKEVTTNAMNKVRSTIENALNKAKKAVSSILQGIKTTFKTVFSSLIGIVKSPLNSIIGFINKVIGGLNKLSIEIPDWVPGEAGGKKLGINIPIIPALAQGGYVKANTPQLAMIGDNRKYGEVVAPENKLQELLDKAVKSGGNNDNGILLALLGEMVTLLKEINNKDYQPVISQKAVFEAVKDEYNRFKKKTGKIF